MSADPFDSADQAYRAGFLVGLLLRWAAGEGVIVSPAVDDETGEYLNRIDIRLRSGQTFAVSVLDDDGP